MKRKNVFIYLLSFFLPIFVLLAVLFLLKIFPFGNGSFLYWDGEIQYVNFYTYLKTVFTSNSNLFYSVSNLGGNNMFDFAAYYNFFSPFNLIFLLFPADYTNIALEILMLIKKISRDLSNLLKLMKFALLIVSILRHQMKRSLILMGFLSMML